MTTPATVALYHPIGILAFQCSQCQRTRVLRILDFSIHDARVSSIGYSEIMTSNEMIPMYENTSKCRIQTPLDPLKRVLNVNGSDLVRKIMDRDFLLHNFFTLENSDAPEHRLVRISCQASSSMDDS
jgi:hypothetical protein